MSRGGGCSFGPPSPITATREVYFPTIMFFICYILDSICYITVNSRWIVALVQSIEEYNRFADRYEPRMLL